MGNMRQEMLGNKSKAGRLNQALHGVLSKRNITAAVIIGGMLLAACGNVPVAEATQSAATAPLQPGITETLPGDMTPEVSETPTLVVTPTAEATATQEVAPVEQKRILMSEKIEYSGYQFDLEFSMLESDKITKSTFDKYEVESLLINENKPGARELLAKLIFNAFLETYNFQNKTNVNLDEYVANPGNYPAKIMLRDDEGRIAEQTLTIDQITSIEMRYTSGLDGELYMSMPEQSGLGSGYGFKEGRFVMYTGISPNFYLVRDNLALKGLPIFSIVVGEDAGASPFKSALGLMPYTVFRMVERKGYADLGLGDNESVFSSYVKMSDTGPTPSEGLTFDEMLDWFSSHRLFAADLK